MAVEYKGCHLVIPVPGEVFYQFTFLQMMLAMEIPDARDPKVTIPHVSLWYLGEAHQDEVDRTVEVARGASHLLKGEQLTVGGWGTFNGTTSVVLYWRVESSSKLKEFRKKLEEKLPMGKNLPFNPHITLVEKVKSKKGREFLEHPPANIQAIIAGQRTFPIGYLALWAKDERGNPSLPTQSLALIEV